MCHMLAFWSVWDQKHCIFTKLLFKINVAKYGTLHGKKHYILFWANSQKHFSSEENNQNHCSSGQTAKHTTHYGKWPEVLLFMANGLKCCSVAKSTMYSSRQTAKRKMAKSTTLQCKQPKALHLRANSQKHYSNRANSQKHYSLGQTAKSITL